MLKTLFALTGIPEIGYQIHRFDSRATFGFCNLMWNLNLCSTFPVSAFGLLFSIFVDIRLWGGIIREDRLKFDF
jgi:hypothetical protein